MQKKNKTSAVCRSFFCKNFCKSSGNFAGTKITIDWARELEKLLRQIENPEVVEKFFVNYGIMLTSRKQEDILKMAAWTEAHNKIFVTAISEAGAIHFVEIVGSLTYENLIVGGE